MPLCFCGLGSFLRSLCKTSCKQDADDPCNLPKSTEKLSGKMVTYVLALLMIYEL